MRSVNPIGKVRFRMRGPKPVETKPPSKNEIIDEYIITGKKEMETFRTTKKEPIKLIVVKTGDEIVDRYLAEFIQNLETLDKFFREFSDKKGPFATYEWLADDLAWNLTTGELIDNIHKLKNKLYSLILRDDLYMDCVLKHLPEYFYTSFDSRLMKTKKYIHEIEVPDVIRERLSKRLVLKTDIFDFESFTSELSLDFLFLPLVELARVFFSSFLNLKFKDGKFYYLSAVREEPLTQVWRTDPHLYVLSSALIRKLRFAGGTMYNRYLIDAIGTDVYSLENEKKLSGLERNPQYEILKENVINLFDDYYIYIILQDVFQKSFKDDEPPMDGHRDVYMTEVKDPIVEDAFIEASKKIRNREIPTESELTRNFLSLFYSNSSGYDLDASQERYKQKWKDVFDSHLELN